MRPGSVIRVRVVLTLLFLICLPVEGDAAGRLRGSGGFANIPLRSQHVEAVVTDGLARTTVRQVFVSDRRWAVEAIYEFPIPEGAALIDVAMEVGGRRYEGLLLDRKRARGIYDRLVHRRVDPALVEELDENIFRLSVFPVLPKKKTIVELTWVEALPRVDGVLKYRYPLWMYDEQTARTNKDFTVSVTIEMSQPLLEVTSPNPDLVIVADGGFRARARLSEKGAWLNRDIVVEARVAQPTGHELSISTWRNETGERWFLAGISAPRFKFDSIPPVDLTFVVDRSASMRGGKLEEATGLARTLIERAHERSGVNVLAFAETVERLAAHVLTGPEARARGTAFLKGLEAGGHTDFGAALEAAMSLDLGAQGWPANTVLLTDGVPNRGEEEADRLIRIVKQAARPGHRLFVMPIGFDADNELLERIAAAGRGEVLRFAPRHRRFYTPYLSRLGPIEAQLVPPVLTGLTIRAEGVHLADVHPLPSDDLFGGHQVFLAGRYEGEGRAKVTVTGRFVGRTLSFSADHEFPSEPGGAPLVPFLHARRKIEDLLQVKPRIPVIEREIVRTSLGTGVMSPLTSFLVLLPEDRRRLTDAVDDAAMREALRKAWEQRHRLVSGGTVKTSELVVHDSTLRAKPKTPGGVTPGPSIGGGGSAGGRAGGSWSPVRRILPEFMDGRGGPERMREPEFEPYRKAISRGMKWLARHQDHHDGSWDSEGFTDECYASICLGKGRPHADILVTALSTLAWLGDAPYSLYYRGTAHKALDWLAGRQGRNGAIGDPEDPGFFLGHAVATLAFTEMFAFSGDTVWEHRAERALEFLSRCESRSYRGKLGLAPDHPRLSPDSWAALAAITGRATKLRVMPLFPRVLKRLPPESALLSWVLLGKKPGRNALLNEQAGISRDLVQSGETPDDRILFACLSLRQLQNAGWTECREKVLAPLLATQSEEGDEAGSWAPSGIWGKEGGRVATTALSVLILQSHYRYRLLNAPLKEYAPEKPVRVR